MSGDVISLLQLDQPLHTETAISVVKDHTGSDSSFIVSSLLGHCLKNKKPTLLVLFHQSVGHYQNVGLRMFYNLKKALEIGIIDTFDLNEKYMDNIINGKNINIADLKEDIINKMKHMKEKHGTVNIIVEGLSHLFDLGFTLSEANAWCRELIKFASKSNNSFVVFTCNIAFEEDVSQIMGNLLSHMAYTVIDVEALSSGWSTDVSGHLTITYPGKKFEEEHHNILDPKPLNYHYKLFEKGVKIFAPGTI